MILFQLDDDDDDDDDGDDDDDDGENIINANSIHMNISLSNLQCILSSPTLAECLFLCCHLY